MKKKIQLGIRILIGIVLLNFVWRNSHWSVALTLTLVLIGIEIQTWIQVKTIRELKRIDGLRIVRELEGTGE